MPYRFFIATLRVRVKFLYLHSYWLWIFARVRCGKYGSSNPILDFSAGSSCQGMELRMH